MKNKFKILTISLILFTFSPLVNASSVVSLDDEVIKFTSYEKGSNSFSLKWNHIPKASSYIVYNGEEKVYEGKKPELQENNLSSGET
jgi:hypothetical protein